MSVQTFFFQRFNIGPEIASVLSQFSLLYLLCIILFFARAHQNGGARRDRTDDLKLAKLPLSQLSYGPVFLIHPLFPYECTGIELSCYQNGVGGPGKT
jgi:hypothetical protein